MCHGSRTTIEPSEPIASSPARDGTSSAHSKWASIPPGCAVAPTKRTSTPPPDSVWTAPNRSGSPASSRAALTQ